MLFGAIDLQQDYYCGTLNRFVVSGSIIYIVHMIVVIIKIVVPILLIIFGSLDFLKAVTASKEDEIKKGQQTFIKRAIAAVLVFFIVQIVQLIVRFAAGNNTNVTNCLSCFINNDNNCKVKSAN